MTANRIGWKEKEKKQNVYNRKQSKKAGKGTENIAADFYFINCSTLYNNFPGNLFNQLTACLPAFWR
jgi:hypothetical protein